MVINKANYKLLKVKPSSRITNNFYDSIIQAIYSTRKSLKDRLKDIKEISLLVNPITYEIYFDGNNTRDTPLICFGVPEDNSTYIKQRIQGILPTCTLTWEDKDYVTEFQNCYSCNYEYTKDSILSLKIKENNFLQAMLTIKNEICKGEKILFQVRMLPIADTWKSFQDDKWDKVREGKDVTNKGDIVFKLLDGVDRTINSILGITDEIMEYNPPASAKEEIKQVTIGDFSMASKSKKNGDGFKVVITGFIVGVNRLKAKSYFTAIETHMRELEEDNRLVMKKIKDKTNLVRGKIVNPLQGNLMSSRELASIVCIPNQRQQRDFKIMAINDKTSNVPRECLDKESGIRIGTVEIQGEIVETYYPKDRDILAMPRWLICGMGGGKTTALLNQAIDIIKAKQGLIDINYTSKCELAYALQDYSKSHTIIDFGSYNDIPAFKFPEVQILPSDTLHQRKVKAGDIGTEIEYFINCVTADGGDKVTTRMGQYLIAASKIVFVYNNMGVKPVFDILDDIDVRHEWIDKVIKDDIYQENDYEIKKLLELDEDKKGTKVSGILDRVSVLMRDSTLQSMVCDKDDAKFNFIDIMDNSKTISFCMKEDNFRNKRTKDIIISYLMCRIRLAMLSRKNRDKVCHIFFDEAHHLDSSLNIISHSVAEVRKYGIALCFATHYFAQMGESLKKAALNVGGHFILVKGVGENAFNEVKGKISEDWTYEDIREMDGRHSFNMVWIDQENKVFVSKLLPPPVDKNGKKYIN